MAYEQAFHYIILGCIAAVLIGVTFFLWKVNRRAEADRPDENGR